MLKNYTCIICPIGCDISVTYENNTCNKIEGNRCPKGREYVQEELTNPVRTIATSVLLLDGELPIVSVRLNKAVPKSSIFRVIEEAGKVILTAPVSTGQVALKNIAETGADLIVTKKVDRLGS